MLLCAVGGQQQPLLGLVSMDCAVKGTLLPEAAVPAALAPMPVMPMLPAQVDLADFDGSLPRLALQALLQASGTKGTDLRLVMAANKVDLLPKQAVRERLEVRQASCQRCLYTHKSLWAEVCGSFLRPAPPAGIYWIPALPRAACAGIARAQAMWQGGTACSLLAKTWCTESLCCCAASHLQQT